MTNYFGLRIAGCGKTMPASARPFLLLLFLCSTILFMTGCGAVIKTIGIATGQESLVQAGDSMSRADREFNEEEKYYTGRTVACQMLADHPASDKLDLEAYVGKVGQTVAQASGKPDVAHGWHFILMKGDEPEAFSCPGGFVLVSEGLVKLCDNEDELAGVLAHECSHVALDHPMQAISSANRKAAFMQLAAFGISQATHGSNLENLTSVFDEAVKEVVTAVAHGYDKDKEYEADKSAVNIMADLGYDPHALAALLRKLPYGGAIHGDPKQRAEAVDKTIADLGEVPSLLPARIQRFKAALGK